MESGWQIDEIYARQGIQQIHRGQMKREGAGVVRFFIREQGELAAICLQAEVGVAGGELREGVGGSGARGEGALEEAFEEVGVFEGHSARRRVR